VFALDPERAHSARAERFATRGPEPACGGRDTAGSVEWHGGCRFFPESRRPWRQGSSTRMRKRGLRAWASLGFGFHRSGKRFHTARPPAGSAPRPRPVPAAGPQRALVNPASASQTTARQAGSGRTVGARGAPIAASVGRETSGKNADHASSREAIDDYVSCSATVRQVADYVVVNVSSGRNTGAGVAGPSVRRRASRSHCSRRVVARKGKEGGSSARARATSRAI